VAPFGQSDGSRLSADVGNLPAAAIESIEVLKEGGSAIYGADAVGGVINIKFKKQFQGTQVAASYRQFENTDISRRAVSLTNGSIKGATSLLLIVD
jgi:iron complex outermembrane receptor protein